MRDPLLAADGVLSIALVGIREVLVGHLVLEVLVTQRDQVQATRPQHRLAHPAIMADVRRPKGYRDGVVRSPTAFA